MPSKNSNADKQRRGGITKSGNKHLRKMLVELTWRCYGMTGLGGKALCKGWALIGTESLIDELIRYRDPASRKYDNVFSMQLL